MGRKAGLQSEKLRRAKLWHIKAKKMVGACGFEPQTATRVKVIQKRRV
jgi:hypothetical protein